MTVLGVAISVEAIDRILDRMKAAHFSIDDIRAIVDNHLLSTVESQVFRRDVADRTADRIIQGERKAGRIVRGPGRSCWGWAKSDDDDTAEEK